MFRKLSVFIFLQTLLHIGESATGTGPKDPGLVTNFPTNYDVIKGLICYQCRSVSTELQPLCDTSMFRFATQEEKYNMSLLCPSYQGAYCFTKVWTKGKVTETIRGCSGPTDINGELMKVGCMNRRQGYFCLCDTKFCNTGHRPLSRIGIIVMVLWIALF